VPELLGRASAGHRAGAAVAAFARTATDLRGRSIDPQPDHQFRKTAADAARSAKNGEWGTVAELRSCDDSHCASLADKDSDALLKRLNKLLY
jgi:hypothetical protein